MTLDDAKKHLRIDYSDHDDYITSLIKAVATHLEGWQGWLGRCFLEQTHSQSFSGWEDQASPFPDLISAVVKYRDVNGDEQTVSTSDYLVVNDCLFFKSSFSFPALEEEHPLPVTIEWTNGITTDLIRDDLKLAVMMLVAHWYENRESVVPNERRVEMNAVPDSANSIFQKYNTGYVV